MAVGCRARKLVAEMLMERWAPSETRPSGLTKDKATRVMGTGWPIEVRRWLRDQTPLKQVNGTGGGWVLSLSSPRRKDGYLAVRQNMTVRLGRSDDDDECGNGRVSLASAVAADARCRPCGFDWTSGILR